MICPSCRTDSPGPFCAGCGAPLEGAKCAACAADLLPGARFCTACGERVRGRAGSRLPWVLGAAGVIVAVVLVLVPNLRTRPGEQAAPGGGAGMAAPFAQEGSAGSPPPLTGTPREQADRLFDRIMREREAGDTAQARFFLPMALTTYDQAEPLDADGLYHLSLLRTFGGDADGALAAAERVLASSPDHLLALAAAAEAASAKGDAEAARRYHARFVAALPTEQERPVPEYQQHAQMLPEYERAAREYLAR